MHLVLRSLLDLVLPVACAGCGVEQSAWCADCAGELAGPPRRATPRPCPRGLPPVWAMATYQGAVRAGLLAHKEQGMRVLGRPLGSALAWAVLRALGDEPAVARGGRPALLVPAPSRAAAVRARGHDPTLALARRAAAVLRSHGVPASAVPALRMHRSARDQAGLGGPGRAANLAGAVRLTWRGPRLTGQPVVLVDDVVTTGATLAESAGVLRAGGARVLAAAVVAATARQDGR